MADSDAIRARIGIGIDEKVVLYVPTWRDSHRSGDVAQWTANLDLERISRVTGARVLVRAHHMTKAHEVASRGVVDVSQEPFVEDVMAVSDLLITDYSSIGYDFELIGRPVIHYMPDLASYQAERGLYSTFDLSRVVGSGDLTDRIVKELELHDNRKKQQTGLLASAHSVSKLTRCALAKNELRGSSIAPDQHEMMSMSRLTDQLNRTRYADAKIALRAGNLNRAASAFARHFAKPSNRNDPVLASKYGQVLLRWSASTIRWWRSSGRFPSTPTTRASTIGWAFF